MVIIQGMILYLISARLALLQMMSHTTVLMDPSKPVGYEIMTCSGQNQSVSPVKTGSYRWVTDK